MTFADAVLGPRTSAQYNNLNQKRAKAADTAGRSERKRQRVNTGAKQGAPAGGGKTTTGRSAAMPAPSIGVKAVKEVVKQRLRTSKGAEVFEYRCVWMGQKRVEATWETETTLANVKDGHKKLVSAMRFLALDAHVAILTIVLELNALCVIG